jgi:hypothetical protein
MLLRNSSSSYYWLANYPGLPILDGQAVERSHLDGVGNLSKAKRVQLAIHLKHSVDLLFPNSHSIISASDQNKDLNSYDYKGFSPTVKPKSQNPISRRMLCRKNRQRVDMDHIRLPRQDALVSLKQRAVLLTITPVLNDGIVHGDSVWLAKNAFS